MKLRRIAMVISVVLLFNIVPVVSHAQAFQDSLPDGWTETTVGNASAQVSNNTLVMTVNGTKTTAALQEVVTAYEDMGNSFYTKIDFAVNDAGADREIYITDGSNEAKLATINGTKVTFINGSSEYINANENTVLEMGIDKSDMYFTSYINGKCVANGTLESATEAEKVNFNKLAVKFSTKIIMKNVTSVMTINDFEAEALKNVNITSSPSSDKSVLTQEESAHIKVDFGTAVNFSQNSVKISDAVNSELISFTKEFGLSSVLLNPSELQKGHRYVINIENVTDFHRKENYKFDYEFLVADEGYEAPVITMSEPEEGYECYLGDSVSVKASAVSSQLSGITVYLNGEEVYTTDKALLDYSCKMRAVGINTITVRVTDTYGGYSEESRTVNVKNDTAPALEIGEPTNGTVYGSGDTIRVRAEAEDAESGIAKVEFYYDDVLKGTKTDAPYEAELTADNAGVHIIKVIAYDGRGLTTEESVNIIVENTQKVYELTSDFDDYAGTVLPDGFSGVSTDNGGTYEAGTNTADGTTCFKMTLGETISGGGPFILVPTGSAGRIGFEADIYSPEDGNVSAAFSLRTATQTVGDVNISGGSLKLKNGKDTSNVDFARGVWHHIKYEFDTYMNTYDFWLDGEPVASKYVCDAKSAIGILTQLRITFNGSNTYMMLDNAAFYRYLTAPFVTSIAYENDNGETVSADKLPYNADTIHIMMNTKLDFDTVNKENVKYIDNNGKTHSFEKVSLSPDGLYIIAKTKNGFLSMSSYKLWMSKNIASDSAITIGADSTFNFEISNKPYDVKGCAFYVNGQRTSNATLSKGDKLSVSVTVSNDDGKHNQAIVIVVLRKDDRTISMQALTSELSQGDNIIETEHVTAEEDGISANVYVLDGWTARIPVSDKIFK